MIATNGGSELGISHYFCNPQLVCLRSPPRRLVLQDSNFQGLMVVTQGWFKVRFGEDLSNILSLWLLLFFSQFHALSNHQAAL